MQTDEPQQYSSRHNSQVFKKLQNLKLVFQKVIKGNQQQISSIKHALNQRARTFLNNQIGRLDKYQVDHFIKDGKDILKISKDWIITKDFIEYLTTLRQLNHFQYTRAMQQIISQFVVQLIIGPTQFLYSQSMLLFDDRRRQISINYHSLLGMGLFSGQNKVCRCELEEIASLLLIQNFKNGQFIGLCFENKLKAIALLIIKLITLQRNVRPIHNGQVQIVDFTEIELQIIQQQRHIQDMLIQPDFVERIEAIDKETNMNYDYFLSQVVNNQAKLSWEQVIQLVIQPYNFQDKSYYNQFNDIVKNIAKNIYSLESAYSKQKLRQSYIINPNQNEINYELYLKIRLAETSQQLLFLLRFRYFVDLLNYKHEKYQDLKDKIMKKFFTIISQHKKSENMSQQQTQNYILFISLFSQSFGIKRAFKQNYRYAMISAQGLMLKNYLRL